jgi:hypothetical protein
MAESDFDEYSEGDWPLASWQWNLIFGVVGVIVGSGVGWWVAGFE